MRELKKRKRDFTLYGHGMCNSHSKYSMAVYLQKVLKKALQDHVSNNSILKRR
jgi:hypothetical protein